MEGSSNLVECFWSVQGEGPHVGRSCVFVRFGRCDLRCSWCDSPNTWQPAAACRVERTPGGGDFETWPNPVDPPAIGRALDRLGRAGDLVALTGGEPLLQPAGVAAAAALARERGMRVLLETHGLAHEALGKVLGAIDVVSMDWKLASDVRREGQARRVEARGFHDEHERFLRVARGAPEVYVKVVVTPATRDDEIDAMCARIADCDPSLPLIVQPVTPFGAVDAAPPPEQLLAWARRCAERLEDVRLIPQTHRMLGVL